MTGRMTATALTAEGVIQRDQLLTRQIREDVVTGLIPNAQQVILQVILQAILPRMAEGVHRNRHQLLGSVHPVSVLTDVHAGASYQGFGDETGATIRLMVEAAIAPPKQPTQFGLNQTHQCK